jgi:peptidoglycan/xylan/chitin deacetylase (PgdA/CDA1 family)
VNAIAFIADASSPPVRRDGARTALTAVRGTRDRLRILTYHRIAELHDSTLLDQRSISTTPALFERQMKYLAGHYQVVRLEEVVCAVEQGRPLPSGATLITFDDGYRDLATHAFPVLKRLRLPATVFVPTAYPDHPERAFWWDRLYRAVMRTSRSQIEIAGLGRLPLDTREERTRGCRRLQNHVLTLPHADGMALVDRVCDEMHVSPVNTHSVLGWQELKAAMKDGIAVAAHTRTHPILTNLSLDQARDEIAGSQADIQRELGTTFPVFCYPNGNHSPEVVALLAQMKFTIGVTTRNGQNTLTQGDFLRLNRQNIYRNSSLPVFRLRLSRVGGLLERWRS